jgi:hypothetical protein
MDETTISFRFLEYRPGVGFFQRGMPERFVGLNGVLDLLLALGHPTAVRELEDAYYEGVEGGTRKWVLG